MVYTVFNALPLSVERFIWRAYLAGITVLSKPILFFMLLTAAHVYDQYYGSESIWSSLVGLLFRSAFALFGFCRMTIAVPCLRDRMFALAGMRFLDMLGMVEERGVSGFIAGTSATPKK